MRRFRLAVLLIFVVLLFSILGISMCAWAQKLTHKVVKGDTLWDICEKYYADANLWPKLWQMNPFITNPHLLKPGDVVVLLEDVPMKVPPAVEKKLATKAETVDDSAAGKSGIDVSGFTSVEAIGFLSTDEVTSSGYVSSAEAERMVLSEGDVIYVTFTEERDPKPGDMFTICQKSPFLNHPITGKKLGYVVSFLGKIALREHVKEGIYKADIVKSYRAVHVGDLILPWKPVSPCIRPMPLDRQLSINVVGVKDQRELIGQFSVVYFDRGFNHGIRVGNLFEIVKKLQVESSRKVQLPERVLGRVLILEVMPDTATGVVIATKEEFTNGTSLRSLDLMSSRHVLSMIPGCSLE